MAARITGPAAAPLSERDRQLIALRLKSPKRADPDAAAAPQADAAHLPLFVAADEPKLL